jgi:hypothetical protein
VLADSVTDGTIVRVRLELELTLPGAKAACSDKNALGKSVTEVDPLSTITPADTIAADTGIWVLLVSGLPILLSTNAKLVMLMLSLKTPVILTVDPDIIHVWLTGQLVCVKLKPDKYTVMIASLVNVEGWIVLPFESSVRCKDSV